MNKWIGLLVFLSLVFSCEPTSSEQVKKEGTEERPYIQVMGIAQDAGYPQAACMKKCCLPVWKGKATSRLVSCLGLVDPVTHSGWLFDATPDFKQQLYNIQEDCNANLSGILLTHAHIGHYTGLMDLGREVMGAKALPIYAMPRMRSFLQNNGPWSQLVSLENIKLLPLKADSVLRLNIGLKVTPLLVPHRDEFSETVGFLIEGPQRKALFIPDIDKWEKWEQDITEMIKAVDVAFLDGSFYQNGEIPGRDMSMIPHPFVVESIQLFENLSPEDKAKVHFIHLNHTNPLLQENSKERMDVINAGFRIAEEGQRVFL